ncbi:hypothetical protein MTO96_014433 [Rhipicephalus appendiculatus]
MQLGVPALSHRRPHGAVDENYREDESPLRKRPRRNECRRVDPSDVGALPGGPDAAACAVGLKLILSSNDDGKEWVRGSRVTAGFAPVKQQLRPEDRDGSGHVLNVIVRYPFAGKELFS